VGALQIDTALREASGRLTASLSRDWEIWGPNGGYVASIALRAAGALAPSDHRPASFSCQYISVAAFDEVIVEASPVKKGRNAWLINVALTQSGRTFLQAQIWTTNKSQGPIQADAVMPPTPTPDALKFVHEHLPPGTPPWGGFWANIDAKPIAWLEPGERHPEGAVVREWYRYKGFEAGGDVFLDCVRPLILIDTLIWPAHHRGLGVRPDYIAPSLDLTVWFHEPPGTADWLLAEARADIAHGGMIHGRTRIWTEDGRLVATGGSQLLLVSRDTAG
jgi:acyl-CoA thioesterase-2